MRLINICNYLAFKVEFTLSQGILKKSEMYLRFNHSVQVYLLDTKSGEVLSSDYIVNPRHEDILLIMQRMIQKHIDTKIISNITKDQDAEMTDAFYEIVWEQFNEQASKYAKIVELEAQEYYQSCFCANK